MRSVDVRGRQTGGAHPSVGRRAGALFRLCAAERELAGKPLTPDAGRQNGSTRARRLHEGRGQFRFTGLAKQVGVTLAVVSQMRLGGGHGSSFPSSGRGGKEASSSGVRCRWKKRN